MTGRAPTIGLSGAHHPVFLFPVPRYPNHSSLPPLEKTLPFFRGLETNRPKLDQVAELLRQVVAENRTTHNVRFYSTRDIARFFNISQNTSAMSVQRLEADGLLRRIRGSQTVMLGKKVITRSRIRAVAGLLSWVFAQRFSEAQGDLTRVLAEELWPHHIALDIIPHYDLGDNRPDLNDRLKKHALDFTIWPFPFNHHKEHLPFLQDRGIRNLVIGVNEVRSPFQPQILVDYRTTYEQALRYWRNEHGIRRVLLIRPREFTPRRRIDLFAKIAAEQKMDCHVETSAYGLPAEILAREKRKVGIALLDEHATAEFTFYHPAAFEELARRHRILFGNGSINVPFVPHGDLRVERIFVPITHGGSNSPRPLAPTISHVLTKWCDGDFSGDPIVIPSRFWENGELWRYL